MSPTPTDPTINWDDVLRTCPQCLAPRLTPASASMAGVRVCIDCGIVDVSRPSS
jgi:hypothetical protein